MHIARVERHAAEALRHMTFPMYRTLLDAGPGRPPVIAIGAWEDERPIGLALCVVDPERQAATLQSLYVEASHRGRGCATKLLAAAELDLASSGAMDVTATYTSDEPTTVCLEAVFRKRAWDEARATAILGRCCLETIRQAPYFRDYPPQPDCSLVPWAELDDASKTELRESQARERWIPEDLEPFVSEGGLDRATSLALIVKGTVRGWALTHLLGDLLRFTCVFVHPDLQRRGLMLLLYKEALARAVAAGISKGIGTIPLRHRGMVSFARRRIKPYSTYFGEFRRTQKRLASP